MFSGRYPHNNRVEGFYPVANPGYPVMSDLMKAGGYFTGVHQDEAEALIKTAHAYGKKVAVHSHGRDGTKLALRNGADSIEHGTFLDAAGAKEMKAHGTYYSATLMAFSGVQGIMGTGKLTPEMEAKAQQTFDVWGKGLNLAYRSGVKIALGTDSAVAPHSLANKELELMVTKGGMSPRDALIAATKGGPDLLGIAREVPVLALERTAAQL